MKLQGEKMSLGGWVCLAEGPGCAGSPGAFRTTSQTARARFLKSDDSAVINALPSLLAEQHPGAVKLGFS